MISQTLHKTQRIGLRRKDKIRHCRKPKGSDFSENAEDAEIRQTLLRKKERKIY